MRHLAALFVVAALAAGCGKKPAAAPVAEAPDPGDATPATGPSERDKLLVALKTRRGDPQRDAGERLAALAGADPAILDALVELLRDKTTAGAGKTHPSAATSTREAATAALLKCGPAGAAALKDKGFAILRDGLADPDAAVREHTAHTVGTIGPAAKPLAPALQKLCADPVPSVRGVAFDAVRAVGVADVTALAVLLTNAAPDIRRGAAEVVGSLTEVPGEAVPALGRALDGEDETARIAAATAIAAAAPKGATAETGEKLAGAIRKTYPEKVEPTRGDGPEAAYWRALGRLGKPAVAPAVELLKHKNPLVRALAARTLWDLGAEAKPAAAAIREAMRDDYADVALEAACTLVKLGEKSADIDGLMKAAFASPQPGIAAAAVGAVGRMGADGKKYVPDALAQLASPAAVNRYAAVGFVGTLDPADAAKQVPELAKLVIDDEPLVRRRVGAVLEALGPAAAPAAEALGKYLPDEADELARDQFVEALVAMGPGAKPAVAGLLPLVVDPMAGAALRAKVIGAVAVADPASAEVSAALVKAAAADDIGVRTAAARALGKLNPLPDDARAALVKLLRTDAESVVRLAAVRGLTDAGPRAKGARSDLDAVANGTLPGVDLWGKVALAAVDGDVRTAAGAVRAGLGDRNPNVRAAAAGALLLVGPTAADVPALLKLLEKSSTAPAKAAAATALGRIGADAKVVVPKLIDLLADPDGDARAAAAEALGRFGPAAQPAVPKLKEVVRTDPLASPAARRALDKLGVPDERPKP